MSDNDLVLQTAKEITISVIEHRLAGSVDMSKVEEGAQAIGQLFETIYTAVKEATQSSPEC